MPVPDFAPGEVLTAAAMDSIGLWLVKTQTIGTAVSSVTVSNAFSANYKNYLVTVEIDSSGVDLALRLGLGASATGYYWAGSQMNYASGFLEQKETNAASFRIGSVQTSNGTVASIFLGRPFEAKRTHYNFSGNYMDTGGASWTGGGYHNVSTSYSSFVIFPNTSNITGGTIRVYGYRN